MRSKLLSILLGILAAVLVFSVFLYFKHTRAGSAIKLVPFKKTLTVDFKKYAISQSTLQKLDIKDNFDILVTNISKIDGVYAIYIKDLRTNEVYEYNSGEKIYAASLYKVPLALATYKAVQDNKLTLDTEIAFSVKYLAAGTGSIQSSLKNEYTVAELIELLLKESDNTSQNMLVDSVGYEYINESFKYLVSDGARFNVDNISTAYDIGITFEKIYLLAVGKDDKQYIDAKYAREMLNTMLDTSFDDRISAGLGNNILFAHKIGSWGTTGSWHDCGIAFINAPVVVCVMSKDTTFENLVEVSTQVGKFLKENF